MGGGGCGGDVVFYKHKFLVQHYFRTLALWIETHNFNCNSKTNTAFRREYSYQFDITHLVILIYLKTTSSKSGTSIL